MSLHASRTLTGVDQLLALDCMALRLLDLHLEIGYGLRTLGVDLW